MKTVICKNLGGACDKEFRGETFDEIVEQSKQHGKEMFEQQDPAHLKVMGEMQALMQDPAAMTKWMDSKRQEFEDLPED